MSETIVPSKVFKTIQIIYTALMVGVLVLSIAVYFTIDTPAYNFNTDDILLIVAPVLAISSAVMSGFLYKTMLQKISSSDSLTSKLSKYQTATLIKAALLEGPALFATVMAMQSGNLTFFILTAALLVLMYLKFPTKNKFENEVVLNLEEKSQLNKF